jgi:hypothetical protein
MAALPSRAFPGSALCLRRKAARAGASQLRPSQPFLRTSVLADFYFGFRFKLQVFDTDGRAFLQVASVVHEVRERDRR